MTRTTRRVALAVLGATAAFSGVLEWVKACVAWRDEEPGRRLPFDIVAVLRASAQRKIENGGTQ